MLPVSCALTAFVFTYVSALDAMVATSQLTGGQHRREVVKSNCTKALKLAQLSKSAVALSGKASALTSAANEVWTRTDAMKQSGEETLQDANDNAQIIAHHNVGGRGGGERAYAAFLRVDAAFEELRGAVKNVWLLKQKTVKHALAAEQRANVTQERAHASLSTALSHIKATTTGGADPEEGQLANNCLKEVDLLLSKNTTTVIAASEFEADKIFKNCYPEVVNAFVETDGLLNNATEAKERLDAAENEARVKAKKVRDAARDAEALAAGGNKSSNQCNLVWRLGFMLFVVVCFTTLGLESEETA